MDRLKINKRKRKEYHLRKKKECLFCGKITTNKFCNTKCQLNNKRKLRFKSIENNEDLSYIGSLVTQTRWVKKYLILKYGEKCMECNWSKKNIYSNKIPIELEHINGNSGDNNLKNVKLLCPNCHSLTPTYKALNAGNGRHNRMLRYNEGKSY